MASVELVKVSKEFAAGKGVTAAVRDVTLRVEHGELMTIVGPSGSGKTTLLRLLAGLEEPTRGEVRFDGALANGRRPEERDIGMVFESAGLFPHLSARENLGFGLKLRKTAPAEIERRVRETAELLGINGCLDRLPGQLSGGERQRVAIGRAIVRRPKVILFDEPLSNLDAPLRMELRRMISKLHRELAATMVYVTHDQAEAMAMGDRMAIIRRGEIQQAGAPKMVYQNPVNVFVAGFIGSPGMNLATGRVQVKNGGGPRWEALDGEGNPTGVGFGLPEAGTGAGPVAAARGVVLGFRPEEADIRPWRSSAGETVGDSAVLDGTIEGEEFLGGESLVYLRVGGHLITARRRETLGWKPGERAAIEVAWNRCHWFDAQTGEKISVA